MNEIVMYLSSEARMEDIRALIDSYAVVLLDKGRVRLEWPIQICGLGVNAWASDALAKADKWPLPHVRPTPRFDLIDPELDLRMVQWQPPADTCRSNLCTRWPFYVDYPLQVTFMVGEQWWQFDFTPGTKYEGRRVRTTPSEANPAAN
jgi:hypothetical protein